MNERNLNLIHREPIYEYSRGSSDSTDYDDFNGKFYTISSSADNEDAAQLKENENRFYLFDGNPNSIDI